MSWEPTAIVGIGQTHHKSRPARRVVPRPDPRGGRPRARRRADDWADIDAVVARQGTRPVRRRDEARAVHVGRARRHRQADVPRAHRRQRRRHHRHRRVAPRAGRRVQARAWRSRSRSSRRATRSSRSGAAEARSLGAGGAFAPFIRSYIHRSGAPEHIGWQVAVKDRLNALKNEYAHLKIEDISIEKVRESPMMWEPTRYLESCPSSDGACAVIFTDEDGGKAAASDGRQPAWVLGTAVRSEPGELPRPRRRAAAGRGRLRVGPLRAGRHHQPARADRHGRALRAVQLVRADLARGPRHRRRSARAGRWSTAVRPRSAARSR